MEVLTLVGLGTDLKPYWQREIVDLMSRDKKMGGESLNFVVARAIGDLKIHALSLEELRKITNDSI